MKYTHATYITTFVKEAYGFEKEFLAECSIKELVTFIKQIPLSEEKDFQITSTTIEKTEEFPSDLITITIKINKKTDKVLEYIFKKLSEKDKIFLKETTKTRIDEDCNFYIRLKKEEFLDKQECLLTDSGDCIHIRIKVAAYPKRKDIAIKKIEELYDSWD